MPIDVSRGPVGRIRIDREESRNALNTEHLHALREALAGLGQDEEVRVVVLEGAGQHFSSGADLREVMALQDDRAAQAYFGGVASVMSAEIACPKPVIAKVRGYCLAGAMGLVAAADLAIASDAARFGLPEVRVGLFPMVVSAFLVRQMGLRKLLDLSLTGRQMDAGEALAAGLLTEVHPEADLDKSVEAMAEALAKTSAEALKAGKSALWQLGERPLEGELKDLESRIARLALGTEAREAMNAFFDQKTQGRGGGI